ncbi:MAG: TIGR00268 family protein, partial [Candidatus Aenigmarchaeota archaeon]|nr:TIGR00268 family protein [Candidatus Aenigmarchaeota archaeon]
KPAFACLASRFPYGTEITRENLEKVERAEDIIHNFGIKQLRVRFHGKIARIEVEKGETDTLIKHSKEIVAGLKELGFVYITMDLEGYRMGSLNEVL